MSYTVSEWINLAVRWLHVVAGVLWIGQTALFSWLDSRMRIEADDDGNEQVWMVHSGGFYRVDKLTAPESFPKTLHWFRWEAAITWLSGVTLLVVVYYLGGVLIEPESPLGFASSIGVSVGVLIVGWTVYDLLWMSMPARWQTLAAFASVVALFGIAFLLSQVLSGRAAYIHVGALLGTVMTANVWMRILPSQRRMVEAVGAGRAPDAALAHRAKQRSQHNTFLALPVIFIMISNHFPTASYGHRYNWAMLAGFVLVGFVARELMNRWNERRG